MVISSSCLPTCQNDIHPECLPKDHLTLFLSLLLRSFLLSKSSQEQNPTTHIQTLVASALKNFQEYKKIKYEEK